MNNPLVRIVLIGLLLMFLVAPFAGLAPLLLVILGFAVCSLLWSLVQAFFTANVEKEPKEAGFESSRGES